MKKLFLLALIVCGMQITQAQTSRPLPGQNANKPNSEQRKQQPPTDTTRPAKQTKKGSTGTFTTGTRVPDAQPTDTADMPGKNRPRPKDQGK